MRLLTALPYCLLPLSCLMLPPPNSLYLLSCYMSHYSAFSSPTWMISSMQSLPCPRATPCPRPSSTSVTSLMCKQLTSASTTLTHSTLGKRTGLLLLHLPLSAFLPQCLPYVPKYFFLHSPTSTAHSVLSFQPS